MKRYLSLLIGILLPILALVSCQKELIFFISTSVIPEGAGTISPASSEVPEGSTVTFKATANGEYVFSGWSGSVSGNENPLSVVVTSDMNVSANFILRNYPLTIAVDGEGTISEKVISTKSEYSSGTVVELTAVPAQHWQFSHWDGDLSGSDNPKQITITSAKNVKAVFVKRSYEYNLTITGPGAVDEEIVQETKAMLEAGTIVRLSAYPDKRTNAVFKGWSGDITGTAPVIDVNIDDVKNVTATFGPAPARKYPLPDLNLPSSYHKQLYYGQDFSQFSTYPTGFMPVDYNRDGILDVITCCSEFIEDEQIPIGFYKGLEYGGFEIDTKNHNKFIGPVYGPRKSFYGDFNKDGNVDICIVSHGVDKEPWTGESPIFLMSSTTGEYSMQRITETVGYYHGSAAGDYDNDGDLDVVLIEHRDKSVMLVNEGSGNMKVSETLLNLDIISANMYTCEFFDINHDGFLDLIVGGHEHEGLGNEQYSYKNTTCVFWGNGVDFKGKYSRMPRFKDGYGITLDYIFYDLNNDGQEEIINVRTGDGYTVPVYCGWAIQIVEFDGTSFEDVTSKYLNNQDNSTVDGAAVCWIDMEEIDGKKFLCGRINTNAKKLFELRDGKFILPEYEEEEKDEEKLVAHHGICIYSDQFISAQNITGCTNNPYIGDRCIKFSNWGLWTGYNFVLNQKMVNGVDMMDLYKNDFALEFYIKNFEPSLTFDVKLESIKDLSTGEPASFVYCYSGEVHTSHLGEWERIYISLKELANWSNAPSDTFQHINNLNFIVTSNGGKDFYLDEIRIRKAL